MRTGYRSRTQLGNRSDGTGDNRGHPRVTGRNRGEEWKRPPLDLWLQRGVFRGECNVGPSSPERNRDDHRAGGFADDHTRPALRADELHDDDWFTPSWQ